MELLDRYLQAVKFWLPAEQQDDIAAELAEDIRSQIEEREAQLGRELKQDEIEELLKQRGRPLVVAQQYLPQRDLIGKMLLPAYWFVLKLVLLCYLGPWVAVWVGMNIFSPSYRAHHLGLGAITDLYVLLANAVIAFTVVTIVFAVIERLKDSSGFLTNWSPRKLPPVRNIDRIPRANSGFEVVFGLIFGVWWLKILWALTVLDTSGLAVSLAPGLHGFFWAFLPLTVANIALSAANFVRPYWTRTQRAVKAAISFTTAGVLAVLVKVQPAVIVSLPITRSAQVVEVTLNLTLAISFAIASVVCIVIGCVELWRIYSATRKRARLQHQVAA
jgi:hypothetical protein